MAKPPRFDPTRFDFGANVQRRPRKAAAKAKGKPKGKRKGASFGSG
jgi:hypothetical protein